MTGVRKMPVISQPDRRYRNPEEVFMKKRYRRYGPDKLLWWLSLVLLLSLLGCATPGPSTVTIQQIPAGDPAVGVVAFQTYGCHTCHVIPGVRNANSLAGPPLTAWAERSYIAGKLPNEPVHLIEWLRFPQRVEPGTAMPDMGVTAEDAHHMAAYLYTLRSNRTWYEQTVHWLRLDQWGLTQ